MPYVDRSLQVSMKRSCPSCPIGMTPDDWAKFQQVDFKYTQDRIKEKPKVQKEAPKPSDEALHQSLKDAVDQQFENTK